jgi:tetratricopeptide (TPR) repeat protein
MGFNMYNEGFEALKKGRHLMDDKLNAEALRFLDKAIACEIKEAYEDRAWCLESLQYDFEAIEDFSKAILLKPDDCNLYYGRSLAKHRSADFEGAILDLELAYTFSKFKTKENLWRNEQAIKMGYSSIAHFYHSYLETFKKDLNEHTNRIAEINIRKENGESTVGLEALQDIYTGRSKRRK